jgi:hypothetical protein
MSGGGPISLLKDIQRKAFSSYKKFLRLNPDKLDGSIFIAFFYFQNTEIALSRFYEN